MYFSSLITQFNYRVRNVIILGTVILHTVLCAILHLVLDTTTPGDNTFDFVISYFCKKVHPQNMFPTMNKSLKKNIIYINVFFRLSSYSAFKYSGSQL